MAIHEGTRRYTKKTPNSSIEQQELKQLTDQLEIANAHRIEALIKLAYLRSTTLDGLIDELGIRPPAYV